MRYVAAILVPFLINMGLTPLLILIAHKKSWYDHIDDRKVHSGAIPRIGGVGIFLSSLAGGVLLLLFFSPSGTEVYGVVSGYAVLIASIVAVHIVGLLDDFANLRARYKLWLQVLIALVVVASGRHFESLAVPFTSIDIGLGFFGPVLTFFWIVGITNAVNLIDGLDGLSGGVSSIIFFFLGLSALVLGNGIGAFIGFVILGAALGFLFFNFPPARIFMGDSGSLFLGVSAALLPLYALGSARTGGLLLLLSATMLIVPICDTLSAIVRRQRRGMPFYMPDNNHFHHNLLRHGLGTRKVLLVAYGITFTAALAVFLWIRTPSPWAMAVIFLVWAGTVASFIYVQQHDVVHDELVVEGDGEDGEGS